MSRELLVTSFSAKGAELYGYRCVGTFREFWPQPMIVYVDQGVKLEEVEHKPTHKIPGWVTTRRRLPFMGHPYGWKPNSFIWNAAKFAVKPFVWLDAAKELEEGILTWVDADTVATGYAPTGLTVDLLGGAWVGYLGRGSMHPETGYVSFRLPEALPLIRRCCQMYHTRAFRNLTDGWTDCHVFRAALQAADMQKIRNNSKDFTSHLHPGVWRSSVDAVALSPLAPYMEHLKGDRKQPKGSPNQ